MGTNQYNINRDLSWLDFNSRVLNEALDERTPLLERLRFLDIVRSNNDEFFMKRVGGLLVKMSSDRPQITSDGMNYADLYTKIISKTTEQVKQLEKCFQEDITKKLIGEDIHLLRWSDLKASEKQELGQYYHNNVFPILTPLAVDMGRPFPFLSNLSKSIAISLRKGKGKKRHFARVKIPDELPQWIRVKGRADKRYIFISLEDVIINHLDSLFLGMTIDQTMIFRVTRNASVEGDDEEMDDIMEIVAEDLKVRKFAPIVRFEYQRGADQWLLNFLIKELELTTDRMYPTDSLLPYTSFSSVIGLKKSNLKYPHFTGKTYANFNVDGSKNIFSLLSKKDILLHYPYDSYVGGVEKFLSQAVNDPKVRAIKMTLYRTDKDGHLIDMLIKAAERKIQVACIVELKARFDEERNIKWAQALERAGIHVSYGQAKLKTHAKMLLVIRQENKGLKAYINIGTGNYNSQTSKLYTDLSLFTSNKDICDDALFVFNNLTGRSIKSDYKKLLVAPFNMHSHFMELIEQEIAFAKKGHDAEIIAKMNSLEEDKIIKKLYEASKAGVKIKLIVRGFCCLRAGIKGVSDNIEVYSLVGQLLEHSRIYYFRNNQKDPINGHMYMGSADWMHRNLFNRLEVITPVKERSHRKKIWGILDLILKDNRHLWQMNADGTYTQKKSEQKKDEVNAQRLLIEGQDSD